MERESFVFYRSFLDAILTLSEDKQLETIKKIIDY
jgi:hypothetical protein